MTKPIINLDGLGLRAWSHGDRFEARLAPIAPEIGAQTLGYNLAALPPGKRAFPFHSHRVNEEMFFVLEGEVRLGSSTHKIRRGDVIACPPGDPHTAPQIIKTAADGELEYLAVSTWLSAEAAEYPDSGKIGVLAEFPAGQDRQTESMRLVCREGSTHEDCWAGE